MFPPLHRDLIEHEIERLRARANALACLLDEADKLSDAGKEALSHFLRQLPLTPSISLRFLREEQTAQLHSRPSARRRRKNA